MSTSWESRLAGPGIRHQAGRMSRNLPRACLELATSQDGVISRKQALGHGMSADAIEGLLRTDRWQTLRRGVYLTFTGTPSRAAQLWAAVHRAGSGAVLKNRLDYAVQPSLQPPRTRIEETVLDLVADATTFDAAFGFVSAACQRRLTTSALLAEAMAMRTRIRWRNELREAIGVIESGAHSVLEYRYVRWVERPHGLPASTRQAKIVIGSRSRYLDNLYRDHGLCVELDGQQAHPDDQRWQDQRRINAITEQGLTTLRYGWADVVRWPCQTAAQVGAVLRQRGWPGPVRPCCPTCPVSNCGVSKPYREG